MKRVQSSRGVRVPVQHRDGEGGNHAAAKQSPKGQALPAAGLGRRPDAEGRSEQRAQQKKIEGDAGGKTCSEDQTGEGPKSIMARGQGSRFALQICDRALTVLWRCALPS